MLGGLLADEERTGDLTVCEPVGEEAKYLGLPHGQAKVMPGRVSVGDGRTSATRARRASASISRFMGSCEEMAARQASPSSVSAASRSPRSSSASPKRQRA